MSSSPVSSSVSSSTTNRNNDIKFTYLGETRRLRLPEEDFQTISFDALAEAACNLFPSIKELGGDGVKAITLTWVDEEKDTVSLSSSAELFVALQAMSSGDRICRFEVGVEMTSPPKKAPSANASAATAPTTSTTPAPAPAPKVVSCQRGHALQLSPRQGGWSCDARFERDGCKCHNVTRGQVRFRCEACDFDYCGPCYASKAQLLQARQQETINSSSSSASATAGDVGVPIHQGVTCDECHTKPICGIRFKCTQRDDFDLCERCEKKQTQPFAMIKIYHPQQAEKTVFASVDLNNPGGFGDLRQLFRSVKHEMRDTFGRQQHGWHGSHPQQQQQDGGSSSFTCPQGHPAVLSSNAEGKYKGGFICDLCSQPADSGTERWNCFGCNFDVCLNCRPKTSNNEAPPAHGGGGGRPFERPHQGGGGGHGGRGGGHLHPPHGGRGQFGRHGPPFGHPHPHHHHGAPGSHGRGVFRGPFNQNPFPHHNSRSEHAASSNPSGENSGINWSPASNFDGFSTVIPTVLNSNEGEGEKGVVDTPSAALNLDLAEPNLFARFIGDSTYPSGSIIAPRVSFNKIWSVRNDGDVAWPEGTFITFDEGASLCPAGFKQQVPCAKVGEDVEVSISLTAPEYPGEYVAHFRFETSEGKTFGHRLWAEIIVAEDNDWLILAPSMASNNSNNSSSDSCGVGGGGAGSVNCNSSDEANAPGSDESNAIQAPIVVTATPKDQFNSNSNSISPTPKLASISFASVKTNAAIKTWEWEIIQLVEMGFVRDESVIIPLLVKHLKSPACTEVQKDRERLTPVIYELLDSA